MLYESLIHFATYENDQGQHVAQLASSDYIPTRSNYTKYSCTLPGSCNSIYFSLSLRSLWEAICCLRTKCSLFVSITRHFKQPIRLLTGRLIDWPFASASACTGTHDRRPYEMHTASALLLFWVCWLSTFLFHSAPDSPCAVRVFNVQWAHYTGMRLSAFICKRSLLRLWQVQDLWFLSIILHNANDGFMQLG